MWIQKDELAKELSWNKILDWVVIDGVLWIEVVDEEKEVSEACIVQC